MTAPACGTMNTMRMWDNFFRLAAVTLLGAACIAFAAGQAALQNGAATTAGRARSIVLPRELIAGASATLSVLDAVGRLVPGVALETTDGENLHTDATGRAIFAAPAAPGKLVVHVEGMMIAASAPVVAAPEAAQGASANVQLTSSPRVLELHNRFELAGTGFRGIADEDHVAIGEKQALVLAASPTSIIALPDPGTSLGMAVLSVEAMNQGSTTAATVVVAVEAIEPQGPLRVGQQTTFTVRVRGTKEPLAVEVSDLSPAILRLSGGNPLKLTTSGGEMNEAQFEVVPLAAGKYSIRARLAAQNE